MEVKTGEIDSALENVYAASISQDEVGSLLNEIKSESGMALGGNMVNAGAGEIANPNANQNANEVDQMQ